jgi:hypothetical protein
VAHVTQPNTAGQGRQDNERFWRCSWESVRFCWSRTLLLLILRGSMEYYFNGYMNEWDGKSSENSNYGSSLCLAFRTYKARTRSRRLLLLKTMNKSNYSWGNKSAALAASATCKRLLQVMAPTGMAWHAWHAAPIPRDAAATFFF